MEETIRRRLRLDPVPPLEYIYERVSVQAKVRQQIQKSNGKFGKQKGVRLILHECSGKFQPATMTAILGPSGSGKTTLLNLLSGRLLSNNLVLRGKIIINGREVESMHDYKSVIGYVMQQDLLLPTFTPRETFHFIADMRLPELHRRQKQQLVQRMLESLGLVGCSDTFIGNNLIRGVSGGETKRTSVGVELLINPSLVFLDEPTTGLDSTTALKLIQFLNSLSAAGRTIVTTIHQPSSQLFKQFDKIMLLVQGHTVYHGKASKSQNYFANLGMAVPHRTNPMDHYMKLMNKEGILLDYMDKGIEYTDEQIQSQFEQKLNLLVQNFRNTQQKPIPKETTIISSSKTEASWCMQFNLIFMRSIKNQLRNPLDLKAKIGQALLFAIFTIILYEEEAEDFETYLQNIRGTLFFIAMNICFSANFGSINVFNLERPIFIRERLSNTYHTSSYFIGRSAAYLPIQLFIPFLILIIAYFGIHLDPDGEIFLLSVVACWLGAWMSASFGLVLSTMFSDPEVAMVFIPTLILPLLLISGFFAPLQNVPDFFKIFEYLSMFKYTYQALVQAQFYNDSQGIYFNGELAYKGNILTDPQSQLYFRQPLWLVLFLMGIIGLVLRSLSLLALYWVSNPKRIKLQPYQDQIKVSKKKDNRISDSTQNLQTSVRNNLKAS